MFTFFYKTTNIFSRNNKYKQVFLYLTTVDPTDIY